MVDAVRPPVHGDPPGSFPDRRNLPRRIQPTPPVAFVAAVLAWLAAPGLAAAPPSASAPDVPRQALRTTAHFAFFSDFETNLNDALIAAGLARKRGAEEKGDLARGSACFDALPPAQRAGWNRAVDYYADVVSSESAGDREQVRLRLDLAGVVKDGEWEDPEERRFVRIARGIREAAAPAYEACRWAGQDGANRRWIEALAPLLAGHESALAGRLAEAFQTTWAGLPIRVDVVETAEWSGAHTIHLRPPGAHVLISSANPGYQGIAALEMVFHEASHFLAGRDAPLRRALDDATRDLGNPFRGDLVHAVHFYMAGEIVRRRLREAAGTDYTPAMYALGLFDRGVFRQAIEATWPAYLDGRTTLPEASRALVRALRAGGP
jgi:hypothetical protein